MLTPDDRRAIEGLFDRLEDVERNGPPRDAEAEALIADKIAAQPGAPYYMAQTVLVQEQALRLAEERIEELERRAQQRRQSGGFLGGLFGDNGGYDERAVANRDVREQQTRGPWQRDQGYGYGGGGFLAGAAQTALGVTGGILLGSAIGSLFSAGSATAAEPAPDQQDSGQDQGTDDGGDTGDFGGGDFGDGGGFDMGGDF